MLPPPASPGGVTIEPPVTHRRRQENGRPRRTGFTMLELLVVLVIAGVALAIVVARFSEWRDRAAAQQAAQVFARDLSVARSTSARGREEVVIRFYENSGWYTVTTASGREVARRRFGIGEEVPLSWIDLQVPGDTLVFSAQGIADLSGIASTLGQAFFAAGAVTYEVAFNSLGASRVGEL